VFDNFPRDSVAAFNALAEASSDNTMLISREIWRNNFMLDVPESISRSFWEQLYAKPNQVNLDKLNLKSFSSTAIPRSLRWHDGVAQMATVERGLAC
jgi:hypothetical protein